MFRVLFLCFSDCSLIENTKVITPLVRLQSTWSSQLFEMKRHVLLHAHSAHSSSPKMLWFQKKNKWIKIVFYFLKPFATIPLIMDSFILCTYVLLIWKGNEVKFNHVLLHLTLSNDKLLEQLCNKQSQPCTLCQLANSSFDCCCYNSILLGHNNIEVGKSYNPVSTGLREQDPLEWNQSWFHIFTLELKSCIYSDLIVLHICCLISGLNNSKVLFQTVTWVG